MRRLDCLQLMLVLLLAGLVASTALAAGKYKNLQVLKDESQVGPTMTAWNKALGVKCMECHKTLKTAGADDTPQKAAARQMAKLVEAANGQIKNGKLTCFGCHRGKAKVEKAADDTVPAKGVDPEVLKAMKALTADLNAKFAGDLKGAVVSCGTCHHGQGKIPAAP